MRSSERMLRRALLGPLPPSAAPISTSGRFRSGCPLLGRRTPRPPPSPFHGAGAASHASSSEAGDESASSSGFPVVRASPVTRLDRSLPTALLRTRPAFRRHAGTPPPPRPTHRRNGQQIRTKVFVSRHNSSLRVTATQIVDLCAHRSLPTTTGTDVRVTQTHVILRECPFCPKPTNDRADNLFKLYIQIGGGAYFCHRCGARGSWYDFKMRLGRFDVVDAGGRRSAVGGEGGSGGGGFKGVGSGGYDGIGGGSSPRYVAESRRTKNEDTGVMGTAAERQPQQRGRRDRFRPEGDAANSENQRRRSSSSTTRCLPQPDRRLAATYGSNLLDVPDDPLRPTNGSLRYLTDERGLRTTTLRKYGVGRATYKFLSDGGGGKGRDGAGMQYVDADCITFPWLLRAAEVAEQEALRGAKYSWDTEENEEKAATTSDVNVSDEQEDGGDADQRRQDLGPWTARRIKVRAVSNKSWQRLDPPGGGWGLFGWHTVPHDATALVVTEGEYDAMAVYQATGRPAVSLPNGCRSLPVEVLPLLEKFDTIYLWMDNDGPGREGAEMFAKKIGVNRCLLVQPQPGSEGEEPPKDANDALRMGWDLDALLDDAKILPHEQVMTFGELRESVLHEILHPDKYVGAPVTSLPGFTNLVKGFRRGEMTVLTGPTGSGKTTFLGQLSLDMAEQGINTLWGSFEIKNTRLLQKLLQQFSRAPLPLGQRDVRAAQVLQALADRFESLPLYFMKFHGGSDVDDVLDAMEYAAYVHDVEHIILDNMQFMISRNISSGSSFDKFDMQDIAIEKFRKFATEKNVHVTLVVHPRKEDEGAKLGISSIYGSAKATQEADTVLILQSDGKRKYVEVKKNRFDGTLGFCPLHFQRTSNRYSESPEAGIEPGRYPQKGPPKGIALGPAPKASERTVGEVRTGGTAMAVGDGDGSGDGSGMDDTPILSEMPAWNDIMQQRPLPDNSSQ